MTHFGNIGLVWLPHQMVTNAKNFVELIFNNGVELSSEVEAVIEEIETAISKVNDNFHIDSGSAEIIMKASRTWNAQVGNKK